MSYSFYEVYITAQRAFTAMGFPYGSDEDAAFIIAWLELNKFQGVFLLSNLIQELDNKYDGRIDIKNFNKKIDFHNKSILMKGAGFIDFMNSITIGFSELDIIFKKDYIEGEYKDLDY